MKRIIVSLSIAVTAAFASSPTASASEPTKILPEPTAAQPLTATLAQTGEHHLLTVSGLEVKCGKSAGSETWTSANSGTVQLLFTECKNTLGSSCRSEGEPEASIAVLGEVHFWLALLMTGTKERGSSELVGALVVLIHELKFDCGKSIKTEVVVKGCIAAKVTEGLNALVTKVHAKFTEWSSGETAILEVLPPEATKELACLPTIAVDGGSEELFALFSEYIIENYKKAGGAITIELMNP